TITTSAAWESTSQRRPRGSAQMASSSRRRFPTRIGAWYCGAAHPEEAPTAYRRCMAQTVAVVPRWEWRTFGAGVDAIQALLSSVFDGEPHRGTERYFIGPGGGNVKIRDDLMDVKVLREVDAAGLERWEPVLKTGFPLGPPDVRLVSDAL